MKSTPLFLLCAFLLSGFLFFASCKKDVSKDKQDSWIQIIDYPSNQNPNILLEYKEIFRVDSFFQSSDTLFNTVEPDSIGIVSIVSSEGKPLFAFRSAPETTIFLEYKSPHIIIRSNDSLNIRLANYYKEERVFLQKFDRFSDSLKRTKVSFDSLSVVWLRKHAGIDSLWQAKALQFLKENSTDVVGILPIQSYLIRVNNPRFRNTLQPLVTSLSDYRLVKTILIYE